MFAGEEISRIFNFLIILFISKIVSQYDIYRMIIYLYKKTEIFFKIIF